MLKSFWFAAALLFAASRAALAQQPTALVVGSVRDDGGAAIDGASVRAFDEAGRPVAFGVSDRLGTFALHLRAAATRLGVTCRYCAPVTLALDGQTAVAVVVTRYRALDHDLPDAADLAALPYGRAVDALALAPFVVPSADGSSVSDRGLGGGRGLVVDALAPLADLSTGRSAFSEVPDRYMRSLTLAPANQAYRYGSGAGGGVFAIDQLDPELSSAAADLGANAALALEPRLDILYPAAGISSDDGHSVRRADLDVESGFAGGVLRAGATGAASASASPYEAAGDLRSLRVAYATASRRYRTFVNFTASDLDVAADATGSSAYRSSYVNGSFRLERPGPLQLDAGAEFHQQSGSYVLPPNAYALTGNVADDSLYIEAHGAGTRLLVDAALALSNLVERDALPYGAAAGRGYFVLPSLSAKLLLGDAFYVRAGYAASVRTPTLVDAAGRPPSDTLALTRDELTESALGFDAGGRLRAEATFFRQFSHGYGEARLEGIGASLVWQLAPRISLRAWSLRDDPSNANGAGALASEPSRQLLWATYENPAGLRFDAIAQRDAGLASAAVDLDGDVLVPLRPRAELDAGTSRRNGARSYYLGLRLQ